MNGRCISAERAPVTRRRRSARFTAATGALIAVGTLAAFPHPGQAADVSPNTTLDVMSVGKYNWRILGGNTGTGAQAFGQHLGSAGFRTDIDTNGRDNGLVFDALPVSEVTFLMGHGHPGGITTEESADPNEQHFLANIPPTSSWDVAPPTGVREIEDYVYASELDDVLLLILAACETAVSDGGWGNLMASAVGKNVDTVIGMANSPLIPAADSPKPNSAGNYFWARVGYYLRYGNTVGQSLAKAVQDITAKEGGASGWTRYVIDGDVANPAGTKVVPARPGTTAVPGVGVLPGRVSSLVPEEESLVMANGLTSRDYAMANGVAVRRDAASGTLMGLYGQAARHGEVTLTEQQALRKAWDFLAADAQLDTEALGQPSIGSHSVIAGGEVVTAGFEFADELHRPNRVQVVVDRRSGLIVEYMRAFGRAGVVDAPARISSEQAAIAARSLVSDGTVTHVSRQDWDAPRWAVRMAVPGVGRSEPREERVLIDAVSGEVAAHYTS